MPVGIGLTLDWGTVAGFWVHGYDAALITTGSPPLTRFLGQRKTVLKEKSVKGGVF